MEKAGVCEGEERCVLDSGTTCVLIVEDNPGDAYLIRHMLREAGPETFICHEAGTLKAANLVLEREAVDVILLDLMLPDSFGLETIARLQRVAGQAPIIVLTGLADEDTALAAVHSGAQDYLVKGQGDRDTVRRAIRYAIERHRLEAGRQQGIRQLKTALMKSIQALSLTIDKRDPYTAGHMHRVARLSSAIGRRLELPEEQIEGLYLGSLMHDIGKIAVPFELITKPGRLTTLEFELMKTHCAAGWDIVKDIEFPWPIAAMVLQHHERMDGTGYPNGLHRDAIALEAAIVAVADVVDAMASHRPYRPALGVDAALAEIRKFRDSQFDPVVVDACCKVFEHDHFDFDAPVAGLTLS